MKLPRQPPIARFPIDQAMACVREASHRRPTPIVTEIAQMTGCPFRVLISTILSLRTQDATTAAASARIFALADTPQAMLRLSEAQIAEAIFPVGFYKTKAASILDNCRELIQRYGGKIPDTIEALLELKGVGRKTANLVLTLGHNLPGICVDTHVHRITNRWGYVRTHTPDETEAVLRKRLPEKYWIPINDWLVSYGQHTCKPISPLCSQCELISFCPRIGVTIAR